MTKKGARPAGLAALLLAFGISQAEAQSIDSFPCQIDLAETDESGAFVIDPDSLTVPDEFRRSFGASRQQKVCQGRRNVRLSCEALIDDWPFNDRLDASDFTCLINAAECGIGGDDGLRPAGRASLTITATQSSRCGPETSSCGFARLDCRLQ